MSRVAGHRPARVADRPHVSEPVAKPEPTGPPDRIPEPKRFADWEDWVKYAASLGADEAEIRSRPVPKADLIAVWGTPK